MDSNFITRILYKDIYWRYHETIHTYTEPRTNCYYTASFIIVNHLAFCQAWSINEYVLLCYVMLCYVMLCYVWKALVWVTHTHYVKPVLHGATCSSPVRPMLSYRDMFDRKSVTYPRFPHTWFSVRRRCSRIRHSRCTLDSRRLGRDPLQRSERAAEHSSERECIQLCNLHETWHYWSTSG